MTFDTVRRKIQKAYQKRHNWQKVGDEFGITKGMAYQIAVYGHEPKDPHIRLRLKLPALVPAPVCPKCCVVHVTKRCTAQKSKPLINWRYLFGMTGDELERRLKPPASSSLAELLWLTRRH